MYNFQRLILTLALICCWVNNSQAYQIDPQEHLKLRNDKAREEVFKDWGLGMFVHWSMDAQLGSVISHSMVGASDKYIKRFVNELPKTFDPQKFNPDSWMKIAKLAGVKYMVFTTKHHSGFCMWDTKTTDFNIMNTPYGKDIVKQYVKSCRKHGIKVGFYFSPEDFLFIHKQGKQIQRHREIDHVNISKNKALFEFNKKQIHELMKNYGKIDVVFLDAFDNALIREEIHKLQPKCLVTRGEMETPEQTLPGKPLKGAWEACFTLGDQWQYKPTNENYKSGTKLIEMLIETRAKGGNLLINAGPDPDGIIPFEQKRRFRELALWMFINAEAIHNTRPFEIVREGNIWFTKHKDGSVYAIITKQKNWKLGQRREFVLKSLKAKPNVQISVLGQSGELVEYKKDADAKARVQMTPKGLKISVVRAQRIYNNRKWHNPIIVKLQGVSYAGK